MTFAQLQYLLEIHRTGSVTQAAKNLYVSQSSVSLALSALEKELGFPIFIRSKKGLVPTEKGVHAIHHAASICESQRQMATPPHGNYTNIRVNSIPMPPTQRAFFRLVEENRDRRDISFAMRRATDALNALKYFDLDLSISVTLTPHLLSRESGIREQGLESIQLCKFPGAIKLGKGHRLFHAESVSLADLEDDLFLDSSASSVSRALLSAGIMSIDPKRRIIAGGQPILSDQLIASGFAYSTGFYMPSLANVNPDIRYIPQKNMEYAVLAVYNPQRPMLPEISRYLDLTREEFHLEGL